MNSLAEPQVAAANSAACSVRASDCVDGLIALKYRHMRLIHIEAAGYIGACELSASMGTVPMPGADELLPLSIAN
jgi:hypothetical protein